MNYIFQQAAWFQLIVFLVHGLAVLGLSMSFLYFFNRRTDVLQWTPVGPFFASLSMVFALFLAFHANNVWSHKNQAERAFIAFGKPAAASNDRGRIGKMGMGIGLALARRIVELHGGNVSVHGEAEFGSTFVIELPTGAPGKEDTQLNIEQAKRYAADMSRLLKRRAGKAPAALAPKPVAAASNAPTAGQAVVAPVTSAAVPPASPPLQ